MVFLVGFVDKKLQYSVSLAISLKVCFKAVLSRLKFHNLRTAVFYNVESSADVSHVNEAEFLWWFSVIR